MRLATFNTLPPKANHLSAIMGALNKHGPLGISDLVRKTGLTRTQALCALEQLINEQSVKVASDKPRTYASTAVN